MATEHAVFPGPPEQAPPGPALVHLRVHSENSTVDGLVSIGDIVAAANAKRVERFNEQQCCQSQAHLATLFVDLSACPRSHVQSG